jgi:predicted adenine nucleotide alpha hydrolase (AANH) superfamily ATPase
LESTGHELSGFFFNPNIHPYQEFQRRLHCLERYTALKPVEVIYDKTYDLERYLVGSLKAKYETPPIKLKELMANLKKHKQNMSKSKDGFAEKIKMKDQLQIKLTPRNGEEKHETTVDVDNDVPKDSPKTKGVYVESTACEHNDDSDFNQRCGYCIRLRLAKTATIAKEKGFDAFTTTLLESKYQPHEYIRLIGEILAEEVGVKFHYQDFRAGWKDSIRISKDLDLYRQPYCGCIFSEYERFGPETK